MLRRVIVLFVWIMTGPAFAQTTVINSGSHANFDRLVFQSANPATWTVTQNQRSVILSGNGSGQLDGGRVFDLITRNRISSVDTSSPNRVEVALACDCELELFVHQNRFVVLDVIDSDDSQMSQVLPDRTGLQQQLPNSSAQILPLVFGNEQPRQSAVSTENLAKPDAVTPVLDTQQLRARLSTQISEAASQGLLSPAPLQTGPAIETPVVEKTRTREDAFVVPTADPELGISARTSLNELSELLNAARVDTVDGVCSPEFSVAISDWAASDSFSESLGKIRTGYRGLKPADLEKQDLAMARHYLHFGFGSEALMHLRSVSSYAEERRFLIEIATLLGNPEDYRSAFFQKYAECENTLDIWVFLTSTKVEKITEEKAQSMVSQFQDLPAALQSHLSSKFTRRLSSAGVAEIAKVFADAAAKLDKDANAQLNVAQADIAISEDNLDEADDIIADVKTKNSLTSVEAFLTSVQVSLEKREVPEPEDIALLDSYAREYRETELGEDLNQAAALARVMSGDISNGIELFQKTKGKEKDLINVLISVAQNGSIEHVLAMDAALGRASNAVLGDEVLKTAVNDRLEGSGFSHVGDSRTAEATVSEDEALPFGEDVEEALQPALPGGIPERVQLSTLEQLREELEASRQAREKFDRDLLGLDGIGS